MNTTKSQCNCCKNVTCPLNSQCMTEGIIWKASIDSDGDVRCYFGSAWNNWKSCFYHDKMTLSNIKYKNCTSLSKYVWWLKNHHQNPTISWEIIVKAKSYNGKGDRCNLCLLETLIILKHLNNPNLLNTRFKLMSICIPKSKHLLKHIDPD